MRSFYLYKSKRFVMVLLIPYTLSNLKQLGYYHKPFLSIGSYQSLFLLHFPIDKPKRLGYNRLYGVSSRDRNQRIAEGGS
jgi:hypothetical protein